ncbi:MAG: histidine kinase [Chitinophagaceae bacterium]|nr:histidine kinase [Chitinophagaceae bacterium]
MTTPLSIFRFRIIFIIFWLLLEADQTMVLHYFGMRWEHAMIDSGISNAILLLLSLLVMNTLRFYLPRGRQYIHIFSLCLFLTLIWLLITKWLLAVSLGHVPGYRELLQHSLSIRFSIAFLLLGCITMISILWFNQKEQKENELRKVDAEKLTKEAELFKLRQQLQPHFLFNSLNSINALIGSRPEEARKMVQQLSDFLRGTLKKEETQWVEFHEELQYLQLYLDIEKVRFGNRLATTIHIADEASKMKVPALLLQPIVENAIKFGLYDTIGETMIHMEALVDGKDLVISISNPFDPETSSPKQGTGFGLKSIQRRLYLLFARNDLLTTATQNAEFITQVRIPQEQTNK